MKKNILKKLFLFGVLFNLLMVLSGCYNPDKTIAGFWENEKKILEFNNGEFIIYNKNSSEVVAFNGTYSFAKNPNYVLKLSYKNAMNSSGQWFSLEGTDLENYTDHLLFKVDHDILETKVIANGQIYTYIRSENPVK